jgi:hypothetical protein
VLVFGRGHSVSGYRVVRWWYWSLEGGIVSVYAYVSEGRGNNMKVWRGSHAVEVNVKP